MNFNIPDMDFQKALALLTREEQRVITLKNNHKARCQLLISTLLVKKAIKDTLHLEEDSFQIKRDKMNRPYIETNEKIQVDFNISHSNKWIVCAISLTGKIGIDIEEIRPIDIKIAKEFMADEEWQYLCKYQGEKVEVFYKYWTLKEAFLKAVGTGIDESIKEINFGALDDKGKEFKKKLNGEIWRFCYGIFKHNYALSVAVNTSINNIRFNNYVQLYNLFLSVD